MQHEIQHKIKKSLKIKDFKEATTRFELVIRVLQTTPLYAKKSHIYRHCSHFSNRRPPYAPPYFSCHYCTPESDLFQTLYPTYMEETWNIN